MGVKLAPGLDDPFKFEPYSAFPDRTRQNFNQLFRFYADEEIMKFVLAALAWLLSGICPSEAAPEAVPAGGVPILLYHRFGPVAADSMTVTTPVFESHLKYLAENGYRVIPLRDLMNMYFGNGIQAGSRYVVLAADDAHISVYTTAFPLLKKYNAPMTLFVYPSAVSNASYAMTWEQLRELKATGLFDAQSHTYWHPNFNKERAQLAPVEFEKLVRVQFTRSKEKLEKEMGVKVDLLAWPFGIFDPWLMAKAAEAGYAAAFTIERHAVTRNDPPMALPRFLLTDKDRGKAFEAILNSAHIVAKRESMNGKGN
jgi:peptidoglycan/xylan/chitin deacetylase (PgdA/CDA1 family)